MPRSGRKWEAHAEALPPSTRKSRDPIKNIYGQRAPYKGDWPARVDELCVEEPERWVQSACVLCRYGGSGIVGRKCAIEWLMLRNGSNGCGMDIGVKDGKVVGVRGRIQDRVNKGRLGPKGLYGYVVLEFYQHEGECSSIKMGINELKRSPPLSPHP